MDTRRAFSYIGLMTVKALDHVNIQTRDMAGTVRFYESLLALEARTPPNRTPEDRQWLYDTGGRAVIHLNRLGTGNVYEREVVPGAITDTDSISVRSDHSAGNQVKVVTFEDADQADQFQSYWSQRRKWLGL